MRRALTRDLARDLARDFARVVAFALTACFAPTLLFAVGGGTVVVKGKPFLAEVAATEREKARGLMYRQTLAKDRCMVFVGAESLPQPIQTRNCLIALDVAWVDAEGRLVEVSERTPPCRPTQSGDCPTYGGTVPARHVIQFPAGTFRRLGLKKGDRVGWELTLDDGRVVRGGQPVGRAKSR